MLSDCRYMHAANPQTYSHSRTDTQYVMYINNTLVCVCAQNHPNRVIVSRVFFLTLSPSQLLTTPPRFGWVGVGGSGGIVQRRV